MLIESGYSQEETLVCLSTMGLGIPIAVNLDAV